MIYRKMNILTFDIEDWYNCDFISPDLNWDKFEVRIYDGVERILTELSIRNLKGTFFCLGWIAEKHPDIIRRIHAEGHQIGCHSYQHELSSNFDLNGFKVDTKKAKSLIENVIGESINAFRAPGFSITAQNKWAFEVLSDLGFKYDSSIFPATHDYGGFPAFGVAEPTLVKVPNGSLIKEFPISLHSFFGQNIVFSGGGYFRLFPYWLIKRWANESEYLMTYFHTRDFDSDQPVLESLPRMRRFKSYVGLDKAFEKFQYFLNDFNFINISEADKHLNWTNVRVVEI